MKRKLLLLLAALVLFSGSLFADEKFYQQGDTIFSFNVGPTIPAFIHRWSDGTFKVGPYTGSEDEEDTGLSVGGIGSINFDYFNTDETSVGFEIGYNFNYDRSNTIYTNVPIAVLYKYYPIQNGKWDVPLTLGAGLSFNGYDGDVLLSLYGEAKAGLTYYFNQNWGLGVNAGLTFIPQINYSSDKWADNGLISYAPITLSLSYRK
jgi:hypothetical protein